MKHIFYFLTLAPLLWEANNLFNLNKVHQFAKHFRADRDKKFDEQTDTQKAFTFCMLGYTIWIFTGMFTFQWVAFLSLFLLSWIPKRYAWWRWLNSLISFFILIFILINAYHLRIDIWQQLLSVNKK